MIKPKLLDLYCGAGGAGCGYHQAGFDVTGVDIEYQPSYPFRFEQADALEFLKAHGHEFDAIHASPPCQQYSLAAIQHRKNGKQYVDLVDITRHFLKKSGRPYVIENVPGAPLQNYIILNGSMFGLRVRRTRWFETSFEMPFHLLPAEEPSGFRMGRKPQEGDVIVPVGHFSNVPYARKEMGIEWMTGAELTQAIPPAYTKYIGEHLMRTVHDRNFCDGKPIPVHVFFEILNRRARRVVGV